MKHEDAQVPPADAGRLETPVRQHTPGPWKVNYRKFSEVRAQNGAVIAECKKLTDLVGLEANARLIAAAPDLLAALEAVLAWGTDENYERAHAACEAARAAIAKAVGSAA